METGRGYLAAQWPKGQALQADDRIYLDAMFSPIKRVEFYVEKTRVGQAIDYDKLTLKIQTNGVVEPKDVIHYGTSVLRTQLEHFCLQPKFHLMKFLRKWTKKLKKKHKPIYKANQRVTG